MLIDLLIIILLISSVFRNWGTGFSRQLFATVGFFGGLFLGRFLESYTVRVVHTQTSRVLMTIVTMLGMSLIGLIIGEYIGIKIKIKIEGKKVNHVDNTLGAMLSVISVLFGIWLFAAIVHSLPNNQLAQDLNSSKIISELNRILPSAPTLFGDIGRIINPNGFPDVFIGSEPIPRGNVNVPALGQILPAVNADKNSVVRVQGQGCGGTVSGSGFVVGRGEVVTNAHVVAGISSPLVEDINGNHKSVIVSFDPNLDITILRVNNLAGVPLKLNSSILPRGTPAAVLGYPGGGQFKADPAAVLDQFYASGKNIYGNKQTLRSIYEVQADVIPGNSGGPIIDNTGSVFGVVFAQSTTYDHVGYALTMNKVIGEIGQVKDSYSPVSSGACAD
jgi:S1-C subfamily serine protease